jgi:xylose isomerase
LISLTLCCFLLDDFELYNNIVVVNFKSGGLNFDSKVRRGSFEPEDLFLAHIAGMDTFAKGLRVAYKMISEGKFKKFIEERYSSYITGIGKAIVNNNVGFKDLERHALENDQITNISGRQETLEAMLNKYILEA